MTVVVDTGEIRISGIEYALNTLVMGSGLPVMGSGTPMGAFSGSVTLDAASSTQFRYDLIVAGADGSVHAVKGTDATADPVMPLLPAAHVRIAHVLVHPNLTAVENHDINALYTTPAVSTISLAFDITTLHGHSIVNDHFDDHAHLTLQVRDSSGNKIGKASPGVAFSWCFLDGFVTVHGPCFSPLPAARPTSASFQL